MSVQFNRHKKRADTVLVCDGCGETEDVDEQVGQNMATTEHYCWDCFQRFEEEIEEGKGP